jgi:hypothetical protein
MYEEEASPRIIVIKAEGLDGGGLPCISDWFKASYLERSFSERPTVASLTAPPTQRRTITKERASRVTNLVPQGVVVRNLTGTNSLCG